MSIVTLDTFKAAITIADTVDDGDLQRALDAASVWIENYCGRGFEPVGDSLDTRTFVAIAEDRLNVPDIDSVSQVTVDSGANGSFATILAPSSYQLYPLNTGQPGTVGNYTEIRIRPGSNAGFIVGLEAQVVGRWGFGAMPAAVEQACIILASRYFHRLNAPFGVLESAQFGSFGSIPEQDPDVVALLAPYGAVGGQAVGSSASTWVAV